MYTEDSIIEQAMDAPVTQVWDAITNPVKMKQWYFDIPGLKLYRVLNFNLRQVVKSKNMYTSAKLKRPFQCKNSVIPGAIITSREIRWSFLNYFIRNKKQKPGLHTRGLKHFRRINLTSGDKVLKMAGLKL